MRSSQKVTAASTARSSSGNQPPKRSLMEPLNQERRKPGFESILRLHDELAGFAHRAAAPARPRDVVHPLAHGGGRFGHREREPAAYEHRKIDPVVSHVGAGDRFETEIESERGECLDFVFRAL